MRNVVLAFFCFAVAGCARQNDTNKQLQAKVDSLSRRLEKAYKPGLGEFMGSIQVHHAKLWFAGQAENWPLADFEVHEIREALDNANTFCTERPEIKSLNLMDGALDSMTNAVQQKDPARFRSSYMLLTNTCNDCHRATKHEFNVIKVPDAPPVSNQEFKMK